MFIYLISIIISITIMNILNFDQFTVLLGVVVGSFFYIVFLIETSTKGGGQLLFQRNGIKRRDKHNQLQLSSKRFHSHVKSSPNQTLCRQYFQNEERGIRNTV